MFGWETTAVGDTDQFRYSTMQDPATGVPLAGVMDASDFLPAGAPPYWTVYWEVEDVDVLVARLQNPGWVRGAGRRGHPLWPDGHGVRSGRRSLPPAHGTSLVGEGGSLAIVARPGTTARAVRPCPSRDADPSPGAPNRRVNPGGIAKSAGERSWTEECPKPEQRRVDPAAEEVEDVLHAGLAVGGQAPQVGPADHDRPGARGPAP